MTFRFEEKSPARRVTLLVKRETASRVAQRVSHTTRAQLQASSVSATSTAETFSFSAAKYPHRIGDAKCDEGWCGAGDDWPRPCEQHNCTGLLHTNFGDYDYDGPNAFWLDVRCYKCGTSEY